MEMYSLMNDKLGQMLVFLSLLDFDNSRTKLLTKIIHDEVEIENDALSNLLDSLINEINVKTHNKWIVYNLVRFKDGIFEEMRIEEDVDE